MLVGMVGFAGAGKDTAAGALVEEGWRPLSFADALKDAVAAIFGWPRHFLEGNTEESRAWRERVDSWWAERLGMPHLTPRWVLRNIGTDVMRDGFHEQIWVARVEREIGLRRDEDPEARFVLTDVRFPDEVTMCRRLGGRVIRVRRGDEPFWFAHGVAAANGSAVDEAILRDLGVHPSEWRWLSCQPDALVENDHDIPTLRARAKSAVGRAPAMAAA